MTALDDAERLLVSGSFERAKGEAAAARKDARSTSERVAAECVWIQAEYTLGGLTRHDLDAARMVTVFGEEFHRASVLLWSRLRLADPTDPAEAEAAAEKALTRIFERTLADRRKPKEDGDKDADVDADAVKATSISPLRQFPPPFTNGNQEDGLPGSSALKGVFPSKSAAQNAILAKDIQKACSVQSLGGSVGALYKCIPCTPS